MNSTSEVDITTIAWCDVELHGLAWVEDGRDVIFRVREPGSERDRLVVCRWAEGLVVNLVFPPGQGGRPLTWDATFARGSDGSWSVALDFAHSGEIRLKCSEVELLPSP